MRYLPTDTVAQLCNFATFPSLLAYVFHTRLGEMYSGKNVLLRLGSAKARAGGTVFFEE